MKSTTGKAFTPWQALALAAFVVLGVAVTPLCFAGAFFVAGMAVARSHRVGGIGIATFGLVYLTLLLGYGIGKDLALRDNAGPVAGSQR